jgi:hypothetical protein
MTPAPVITPFVELSKELAQRVMKFADCTMALMPAGQVACTLHAYVVPPVRPVRFAVVPVCDAVRSVHVVAVEVLYSIL